jgi:hypothetical protein
MQEKERQEGKEVTTTNDITGDKLQTKPTTDKFREGWEHIFGQKNKQSELDQLNAYLSHSSKSQKR